MDFNNRKMKSYLMNKADEYTSKSIINIFDTVKRDHQVAKYSLMASVLYRLAGEKDKTRRYWAMWNYLHKLKR